MHDTSLYGGRCFAEVYGQPGLTVLDIGGQDFNGSLKKYFVDLSMNYICVDIEEHHTVDVVMKPGDKLPFKTASIDLIISTSCFEHDPCFWMTFKEMCRVTKLNGLIYVNAPGNGEYHKYPGDNWRFYPDCGQALAHWSCRQLNDEKVYPVKVKETFYIYPKGDKWKDFVCIWKRTNRKQTEIIVSKKIKNQRGPLKKCLIENGFDIEKEIHTN